MSENDEYSEVKIKQSDGKCKEHWNFNHEDQENSNRGNVSTEKGGGPPNS